MSGNQNISFSISNWAAWAPGLTGREDWQAWVKTGHAPHDDGAPPVAAMPPMQRRRLLRLGRMTLENMYALAAQVTDDVPIVFASRHGETHRALPLQFELHERGEVSPQSFSLAVHNAIAGLFTIANRLHCNVLAVSGGEQTARAGLVEAAALLAEGAPAVLLLVCDEPLPEIFQAFADEPQCAYAYGLLLESGQDFRFALPEQESPDTLLPEALSVFRFLIDPETPSWRSAGAMPWGLMRNP